ncbi:MAG: SpoIIE family protein phosphatase [Treponema sp.]|nr:SpoIIE family protein phosphatase [Treponema sp.]
MKVNFVKKLHSDFSHKIKSIFILLCLALSSPVFAQHTFFWDNARTVSARDSWFPRTVDYNNKSYVFWEEVDSAKNQIWISSRCYTTTTDYTDKIRFAGPFPYSGEVPDMYSAAISNTGTIIVAVASDDKGIQVFASKDGGTTYTDKLISSTKDMIAPRVYNAENGRFRLFTSVIADGGFQLYYADSRDGLSWSSFKKFNPGSNFRNPFLPVSIVSGNSDIVVFQAQSSSSVLNRYSYQLFMTTTKDGSSWTTPVLLTDQNSLPESDPKNYASYQNQRPNIYQFKNRIFLAWERTENINSQIWIAELGKNGMIPGSSFRLTSKGSASRPLFFEYDDTLWIEWFDNRNEKQEVYMAEKIGERWDERKLISNKYDSMFSTPSVIYDTKNVKRLFMIYQQSSTSNNVVTALMPDTTVDQPKITSSTYSIGKRSRERTINYKITFPDDSSGLEGYSYTWGKENEIVPEETVAHSIREKSISVTAEDDGIYNLIIAVKDKAGNWSSPQTVAYHRDLTPPAAPGFAEYEKDDYGFAVTNTFDFTWTPSTDSDVAGYNYQLEYIGSIPNAYVVNKTHSISQTPEEVVQAMAQVLEKYQPKLENVKKLKSSILTSDIKSKTFNNRDNGIYRFTVCAVDEVGNVSEPASILVALNKYRPTTFVTSAYQTANKLGELELTINGGGFTYEGIINKIYIDRDGKAPYDLVLSRDKGEFKLRSDNKITNVQIGTALDEGTYRVGLVHTDRGLYFTGSILKIDQNGTVKIQSEYQVESKYRFIDSHYKLTIAIGAVVLALLIIVVALIILFTIYTLTNKTKERRIILKEIKALLSGEAMPSLKRQKNGKNEKQRSLRGKLVIFTIIIVILVTLFLTLQNGLNMINTQQNTMADALQNKISVLLESLTSGVKNFLPTQNDLELGALPSQKDAMVEAKYVTIIGEKSSELETDDESIAYIWATNDPDIEMKVKDFGQNGIVAGQTRATDPEILQIVKKFENINEAAGAKVDTISQQIAGYSAQITALAEKTDENSIQLRNDLSDLSTRLRNELNNVLTQTAYEYSGSTPNFTHEILASETTDYLFYKPVLYRSGSSANYLHGVIIIQVSSQSLVDELHAEIRNVIITAAIAAIAALILGTLAAWLLASVIVKPIKKLESQLVDIGIIMTREAKERMRLSNRKIEIKSKDEIGHLGQVVNSMTEQLGKAAEDEFLNNDGKKVQGRFVPLAEDGSGGKLPIVKYKEEKLDLFAFYKGDSPVSGDYFDFKQLDDKWYVFIKCDVSGHGVPAALLVSVVATKFKDFYYNANWNYAKNGINLKKFVSSVNDFIYDLGARGKFSTINISLYNRETGELYNCNAGDNKIHILDAQTKQLKEITLSDVTPTAGGIPSDLIEMKGGFKVEKLQLNRGDILYLYTDGIDEAERLVRDFDFTVKKEVKEEKRLNRETGKEEITTQILELKEQFGQKRIEDIIQAVARKQTYILEKQDNPVPSDILEFDFSTCEGTLEESIVALASIERVFRMLKTPDVRETNEITVDNFVDDFLKEHFNLYSKYCIPATRTELDSGDSKSTSELDKILKTEDENVRKYSYIAEDKQADDITLIAIRRL